VRTDSHRFVSAEQGLWDSQDILEARSVCKKILELVPSGPTRDRIDGHLQDLIIMMQSLEESNLGLFDLNNELDAEISQHDPQPYNPSYEFVHEQSPEWNIDAESILEPTQEEISDTPESKTSKKRQLPPKATPKQLQP
jgi:hypothetical protein